MNAHHLAIRTLVMCGSIAWLTLVVSVFVEDSYRWLWWTALLVFLGTWIIGRVMSRDIAEKRPASLDEYEARLRNRARSVGYWFAILGGIALFIVLSVFARAEALGGSDLTLHAPALLLALVLAVSAVPTFVLSWTARGNDA
jgi:hypothetical protein